MAPPQSGDEQVMKFTPDNSRLVEREGYSNTDPFPEHRLIFEMFVSVKEKEVELIAIRGVLVVV